MRSLEHARAKAREFRRLVGTKPNGLAARLTQFLWQEFGIRIQAVAPELIRGSRAEVSPGGRVLKYNERLAPAELLEVLAHELGHLVLHERLTDDDVPYDPILGSAYADAGPGAIARYSPRIFEEAQAAAFATEFLCPSDDVLGRWQDDAEATATTLAAHYGVSVAVVRIQLAHALHVFVLGEASEVSEASGAAQAKVRGDAVLDQRAPECDSQQLAAARFLGAAALVDAGPGTGKTTTLVRRIRFLLEEREAHPRQVLVLTFSNEAAEELRRRVARAFGADIADQVTIATFHGFGMTFLHSHGDGVGLPTDFAILDEAAQAELVSGILGRAPCERLLNLRDPEETVAAVVKHIGHCKDRLRDCEALAAELARWTLGPGEEEAHAQALELLGLYREYERAKAAAKRVDFADLIMLPIRVLERRADIAAAYREKYPWVLVDEFQDVTRATSALLRQICGSENPPWVVGDARQAIYRFRGAAPENVVQFAVDFPGAKTFELEINYRSCGAVVGTANTLAALMIEAGDPGESGVISSAEPYQRWRAGSDRASLGEQPIRIAAAASDHAEREGIAREVKAWLATGEVEPGDIAVLARRNVDVRAIVLALSGLGVRAAAGGLLTAEGAAGDLAAAVTLADAPAASVPRIAYALGRTEHAPTVVNAAVQHLLLAIGGVAPSDLPPLDSVPSSIVAAIQRARTVLVEERFATDGFATLAAFLFDASDYLRRLLDTPDSAERAMALVEVVSALSLAAAYRITHPRAAPADSRIGFAELFRRRLTETTPLPITPRPRRDAVLVMTCHASKGLEFPCAVVAGQTVPKAHNAYGWLPPTWRPTGDEDLEQADALLFVGVTRGQRAVLVSYPTSAGGGARGRKKQVVQLLERWCRLPGMTLLEWDGAGPAAPQVRMGPIWGGRRPTTLRLSSVDADTCAILSYMEHYLGTAFPAALRPLYPAFVAITRRTMREVIALANDHGRAVTASEADELLAAAWPHDEFAGHPHVTIYRETARRMTRALAAAYAPSEAVTPLDPDLTISGTAAEPVVRLDLVGHYRTVDGVVEAISFRPESLPVGKTGGVNWSDLGSGKRISFVLLERATPGIRPRLFSGADGRILDFRWSTKKDSLPNETAKILGQLDAIGRGEFEAAVSAYTCDGCRARVSCPYWTGALT